MTNEEIIERLKRYTGASDVYHVNTFEVDLARLEKPLTVKICDAGSRVDSQLRYFCIATSSNGKEIQGSNVSSIDDALSEIDWSQF